MQDYPAFPKIPRLLRECVISEKIDGTNGQIYIGPRLHGPKMDSGPIEHVSELDGTYIYAGSRNRWLTPGADNFGFAKWVADHSATLLDILGPGTHYGEWWGQGIQRGYGQTQKNFSLFNTHRWAPVIGEHGMKGFESLRVVPSLWWGTFSTEVVSEVVDALREMGSRAAPGFMLPEGVITYHTAAKQYFKTTLVDDQNRKELGLHTDNFRHNEPIEVPGGPALF